MARETFGRRLKRLRTAAGLTQAELARAAGLPFDSVRNWEYDKREPALFAAVKLATALGVDLNIVAGSEQRKGKHQ
jgi:transcriptional regulator with XRE-family HTH domain